MPDWHRFVRQRLDLHRFRPEVERRAVRELAAQLADFYRDAISRGLPMRTLDTSPRGRWAAGTSFHGLFERRCLQASFPDSTS